jgi:MFS family permease
LVQSLLRDTLRKSHYGWVIFCLAFANLTTEGAIKNTAPVLFLAFRESFNRSAAATAGIFSTAGLTGTLLAPLLGGTLDRLGPRYLFVLGGVVLLIGYLASSLVTEFWQLFIFYGVVITIGENAVSSFTATANLAPWFPRNRGRALGLADAGNPVGQGIFTPLTQLLISLVGWRTACQILGPVFCLMVVPANLLLQRRPPRSAPSPDTPPIDGESAHPDRGTQPQPRPPGQIKKLVRSGALWYMVSARTVSSVAIQLTNVHMVAFFVAGGYTPIQAATTIGAVGMVGLVGRPMSGSLSDVLGRELVYTLGFGMQITAILVVLLLGNGEVLWPLVVFVAFTGLSDGIGGLALSAKAADLIPADSLGSAMGIIQAGRGVGLLAGPVVGGLLFDLQGDYVGAYLLAVGFYLAAIGCMWATRLARRPVIA